MDYPVKNAAEARSNLNIWAAVVVMMENSLLVGERTHGPSHEVIDICRCEIQKELKIYDIECEKATSN